jgi:hypothetical protein
LLAFPASHSITSSTMALPTIRVGVCLVVVVTPKAGALGRSGLSYGLGPGRFLAG